MKDNEKSFEKTIYKANAEIAKMMPVEEQRILNVG